MKCSQYQHFRAKSIWTVWIGVLVYVAIFLVFYPRITAIVDENAYLTQAFLFKSTKLAYDEESIPRPILTFDMREAGGHIVSKYPPGNSLWLVPFLHLGLGWRGVFLSGLMCALLGTWLIALILRQIVPESDPRWALLYLFYPTVVVFSRTIMSDLPATTGVIGSFYFLLRGNLWVLLAGWLLGVSALFRYPLVVLVIPFLVILFLHKRRFNEVALFLLGLLPPLLGFLLYNRYAFGSFIHIPMWPTDRFGVEFIPHHLLFYSLPLLVWYPLMLVSPLLAPKNYRLMLSLPPLILLSFYSTFSFTPATKNLLEQVVIGLRYLLPALPFFIISFALGLERMPLNSFISFPPSLGAYLRWGIVIPVLIGIIAQCQHHRYLQIQEFYAQTLLSTVPPEGIIVGNKDVIELLNVAWGWRDWLPIDSLPEESSLVARPFYLALLEKSGKTLPDTLPQFRAVLEKFPNLILVNSVDKPHSFRIFRVR